MTDNWKTRTSDSSKFSTITFPGTLVIYHRKYYLSQMFKKLKIVCNFNVIQYKVTQQGHNDRVCGVSITERGRVCVCNSSAYLSLSA